MEVEQNYNFLIDYLYKYDYDANVFETSNPHELIRNLWITTKELNIGIPRPVEPPSPKGEGFLFPRSLLEGSSTGF